MTPANNLPPSAGNESSSAREPGPSRGALAPAGASYPLMVESDGFESGPLRPDRGAATGGPAALLKALQHRWLLALVVGLACGVPAGLAMWYLKPANYTAYALLRVAASEPQLLEANRDSESSRTLYLKTQAALITSRPVLRRALREEKVRQLGLVQQQADIEGWLQKELKAGYLEDTDILKIALTGPAPNDLAVLLNTIQASYMEQIVGFERKERLTRKEDLERIVMDAQEKLRNQRKQLQELANIVHTGNSLVLTAKQKNTVEEYAALKREAAGLRARLLDAERRLELQKANLQAGDKVPAPPEYRVTEELERDPAIAMQSMKIADLQERLRKNELNTTARNPLRTRDKEDLRTAEEQLEKLREEKRGAIIKRLQQRAQEESKAAVTQLETEIKLFKRAKQELDSEVSRVSTEFERIGTTSVEVEIKRADIEQAESVVKQLLHEKDRLSVELQAQAVRRITLLQQAEPPETANIKAHVQESLLVGLCALALGAFCVGFREYRSRWINTPDQVSQELGLKVVGTLPDLVNVTGKLPAEETGRLSAVPAQMLVASVDNIRAILSCSESLASIRVLMVSSAVSREGKTTVAAQLATSFARAGQRTLLIDFDLRKPSLHQILGGPQEPGVCEVLRGDHDVERAIRATEVPGLFLLAAGQPSRLLHTACLQQTGGVFFERLRSQFDFIVIDTCPILPVPDALFLGQYVDAAVLAIRPRVSRSPAVLAACERLRSVNIRLLGTVVNGVRTPSHGDYYYQYVACEKEEVSSLASGDVRCNGFGRTAKQAEERDR
jgi:polysaccharide biosynthesis transport protein